MGLDWGEKRIGIALSDPEGVVAQGKCTYGRKDLEQDIGYISDLVRENGVGEIVLGLPVNMDGSEGFQVERVQDFKRALEQEVEVPVRTVDERLTSDEAERVLRQSGMSHQARAEKRDELAATLILQRYLDLKD